MKHKIAKEFKKRYTEQYIDYDIINNYEGYRCVEVFTKDGSKYNLLNKQGYVISNEWYDDEIIMARCNGVLRALVEKDGLLNYIDERGSIIFPDMWFKQFYGIYKGIGSDGKHYICDEITGTIKEVEKEKIECPYSGGYGMRNGCGNWF